MYLIFLNYRDSYESRMLYCHAAKLITTLDTHMCTLSLADTWQNLWLLPYHIKNYSMH